MTNRFFRTASKLSSVVILTAIPFALSVGCGSAQPDSTEGASTSASPLPPRSVMLRQDPGATPQSNSLRTASAPAGTHLTYYGGRVVSNIQVVQVLWGAGSYHAQVTSTATPSIGTFYQQMSNSAYFDWLTEFNTSGGTNQTIGHGSFLGQYPITPSVTGTTVSQAQLEAEIQRQINAGHLPAPTHDAGGNNNSYYAVFFPHGITITQGTSRSCASGGFCAFHGTIANSSTPEIYYGVHPDMQAGSGCDTGCGTGTSFDNYTSVASHELVETVTDAEVGIATANAAPLAWYDTVNGEIGDICNAQQASIVGGDGVTYTVQKEFSNVSNDCIASRAVANGFTVSDSPSAGSVAAGSSATTTITVTDTGAPGTVSLSASGLPAGAAATFAPSSLGATGTSTLTVSTTAGVAAGIYAITITGTAGTTSHTASYSLTVTSGGGGGGSALTNGGFETGNLSSWTSVGLASVLGGGHSGSYAAQVGGTAPSSDSNIGQTFTAPSGATGLSFFYKVVCPDSVSYDWASATLKDNTAGTTATVLANTCTNSGAWVQASASVTAGHSYTLTLASHDDNYAGDPTYTLYDDVVFASGGGGGGGGANAVLNGGLESGSFSSWTPSGASESVVVGGHSGSYAARLGSTSATNGDSSISQTFTAAAGDTILSFSYKVTCPDSVTYDWATAILKDNTSGITSVVLNKTCTNTGSWASASAAITAGHGYTLTLTSHDDNYGSDPTYTLYDDVATH